MSRRPRVVMVVANAATSDTRVMKSAASVASSGCEVIVVGASSSGRTEELQFGEVRVILQPPRPREDEQETRLSRTLRAIAFRSQSARDAATTCRATRQRRLAAATARAARRSGSSHASGSRFSGLVWRAWLRCTRTADSVDRRWFSLRCRATDGTLASFLLRPAWRLSGIRRRPVDRVAREFPQLTRLELSVGPCIDSLRPDVLHAHDFTALAIVANAAGRGRGRGGRGIPWVYDAHELVRGLTSFKPERLAAAIELETRHIRSADQIITVSEQLATRLEVDYALPRRPHIVLNAPRLSTFSPQPREGVRDALGLADEVPLAVYPGNVKPLRGLDAVVDALALLPGLHLVLVTDSAGAYLAGLVERAALGDCAERLHVLPYVESHRVSSFIASATFGVNPLLRYPNSEVALPNKIFEYLQARLPIVTTGLPAIEELVVPLGIGETFPPGDPAGFAAAAGRVLGNRSRYAAAFDRHPELAQAYSWEAQEQTLHRVYDGLLAHVESLGPVRR